MDALDFQVTLNKRVFDLIEQKNCNVIIVLNKIDVFPKNCHINLIKGYIKKQIRENVS